MRKSYSTAFKQQAVEKALNRADNITIKEIATSIGIGLSSLTRWISQAKTEGFETNPSDQMKKDKRPHEWTLEERLNMVIHCASLSDEALNAHCRQQGVYPHQVNQWKQDFATGNTSENKNAPRKELKDLKHENNNLKKELRRKDKALAETAALLVLKKKVNAIWGNDEDN